MFKIIIFQNFNFEESGSKILNDNNISLPQNAGAKQKPSWPEKIINYFSLGQDGKSILKTLGFGRSDFNDMFSEEDWEDKDYREIPH
jgi:hypothetical protein